MEQDSPKVNIPRGIDMGNGLVTGARNPKQFQDFVKTSSLSNQMRKFNTQKHTQKNSLNDGSSLQNLIRPKTGTVFTGTGAVLTNHSAVVAHRENEYDPNLQQFSTGDENHDFQLLCELPSTIVQQQ